MKSIAELKEIREQMQSRINMRKEEDEGIRVVAVSYTHLDVYKRQAIRSVVLMSKKGA